MEENLLFQITKDHLETGMRNYPVGYCTTSFIDPIKGLFYRDNSILEIYNWEPERVIYLLYYGKKGSAQDIRFFSNELKERSYCSQAVIKHIYSLPRQGQPMELFKAALLILGMFESQGDYQEDCLNLIAKLPHLVALVINYHAGWGETPSPNTDMGYMENFVYMLQTPKVEKNQLTEVFRLFNILHYDHGGGNLSTFIGKTVSSGLEGMYGAICAAICGLDGPLHGKANQGSLLFIQSILDTLGEDITATGVQTLIRKTIESNKRINGFGHAVLRAEDARATILYDYAKMHFPENSLVKTALLVRKEGPKILKENPKNLNPYPNIDAISGVLLSAAGFPFFEYYTVIFGLARSIGISIQIVYERCGAKEGKGTPIIRPQYIYKHV